MLVARLCVLLTQVKSVLGKTKRALTLADAAGKLQKLQMHENILITTIEYLDKSPPRGKPIENIVEAATRQTPSARLVEGDQ